MNTWIELAIEAENMAAYYASRGEHGSAQVKRNQADTYRRTAKAMELTEQTGKHYCSCCLKIVGPKGRVK